MKKNCVCGCGCFSCDDKEQQQSSVENCCDDCDVVDSPAFFACEKRYGEESEETAIENLSDEERLRSHNSGMLKKQIDMNYHIYKKYFIKTTFTSPENLWILIYVPKNDKM